MKHGKNPTRAQKMLMLGRNFEAGQIAMEGA